MPNNNLMQPQPPGVRNGNESTGLCDSRGSAGASRQVSGKVGKVCEAGCREVQRGWKDLVHSVEGGVARVELDGGEGRLTAGGSSISQGGSDGWSSSSQGSGGSSNGGHGGGHGGSNSVVQSWDSGNSGVVQSWDSGESSVVQSWDSGESGVVEGKSSSGESGEVEAGSVGVGQGSDGGSSNNSLLLISATPLPLSVSGLQESEVCSLGLGDLRGVLDGLRGDSGEDGGDQGLGVEGGGNQGSNLGGSECSGADWEVGASNSESVDWVGNIVDGLEETVGIDVLVGPSGHTVGIAGLKNQKMF